MPMPGTTLPPVGTVQEFYGLSLAIGLLIVTLGSVVAAVRWRGRGTRRPAGARTVLTVGLGVLWMADGALQAQPRLITDFVSAVLVQVAAGQPHFVRVVVVLGARAWAIDPWVSDLIVTWLQVLLGALIVFGGRSRWRRAALWASIPWALTVWAVGEGFGGLGAHGSWLAGAPGSALLYAVIAGALVAPGRWWSGDRPGRIARRALTVLWLLAFTLQAWPTNGWWSGPSSVAGYLRRMAAMPQPHWMSAPLWAWAGEVARAPAAWNAIVCLVFLGLAAMWAFWGDRRWSFAITLGVVVETWWLGQDAGVFGGAATDPQSGAVVLLALVAYALYRRRRRQLTETATDALEARPA